MKKVISLLLIVVIIMLAGCSDKISSGSNVSEEANNIQNSPLEGSWNLYKSAESLVSNVTHVFEGKVVRIFFDTLDLRTGNPQREPLQTTEPEDKTRIQLYTVYEIEVFDAYKGETNAIEHVCIIGGVSDYQEAQQKQLMENAGIFYPSVGIPVLGNKVPLEIDASYLFCVVDLDATYKYAVNPTQYALSPGSALANTAPYFDPSEILAYIQENPQNG